MTNKDTQRIADRLAQAIAISDKHMTIPAVLGMRVHVQEALRELRGMGE